MYNNNNSQENIKLPENIDDYIYRGIKRGKTRRSSRIIKHTTGVVMCLALTLFIASILVSPVMASNVSKIPGLKYIVELVRSDKGLLSAIDNDYIQNIDKSCEKLGIKLTIKDIIADNNGIIVFYSIENNSSYKSPQIWDYKLLNEDGEQLKMNASSDYIPTDDAMYEGKIEFSNDETNESSNIPDVVILQTNIAVKKPLSSENDTKQQNLNLLFAENGSKEILNDIWEVASPIDQTNFTEQEKVYKIEQSVEVEGQKILFEDIKIYPTESILSISFDKTNTKELLSFEDLKIIDENGKELNRKDNGIIGSSSEFSKKLYFQSNYFENTKELYITGNLIKALDKKDAYFIIDTQQKQITYLPNNLLSITELFIEDKLLSFQAELPKELGNSGFEINKDVFIDPDGNEHKGEIPEMSSSDKPNHNDRPRYRNYSYVLNDKKGPVKFNITDYPCRIKGAFKVRITLDN